MQIKTSISKKKKELKKSKCCWRGYHSSLAPFLSEFLTLFMVSLDFAWLYVWMTPGALSNNNTTTTAAIAVGLSRMKVTDVVHAWQRSIYHIFIRNRDACDPSTMAPSSLKTSTEWSFFCVPTTYRRSKGRGELRHNVLKNLLKRCKLRTFLKKATLFINNKIYAWWNCLAKYLKFGETIISETILCMANFEEGF